MQDSNQWKWQCDQSSPVVPKTENKSSRKPSRAGTSGLRPPTLMIDLLFGALMLFAFQMGNPQSQKVSTHNIELPTTDPSQNEETLLGVVPTRNNVKGEWLYQVNGGSKISASGVAKIAAQQNAVLILLLPHSSPVQQYLDAEAPLKRMNLRVGLAVIEKE